MAARVTKKSEAWALFDYIVDAAAPGMEHTNPWVLDPGGSIRFEPDYRTLELLLGVPLHLRAETQSGVPALALDVWLSYELRRAGFETDQVWPRPTPPRIFPAAASALIKSLPKALKKSVEDRVLSKSSVPGVTSSSAVILGKNYLKQVDVIISDWATGPELLVSTKRMDSSFGKNAPNRIEESYGDAKNLRLRHPLAALGFMFGLSSDIFQKEPKTAAWLFDLLTKLGLEDDAYHATCVVLMEYSVEGPLSDSEPEAARTSNILTPGLDSVEEEDEEAAPIVMEMSPRDVVAALPAVKVLIERTPPALNPGLFLQKLVERVLGATPVNMHEEARGRRSNPAVL